MVPDRFSDRRHEAFAAGLRAAGLRDVERPEGAEALVTWNRHRAEVQRAALACEARGGQVVVCEEAYTRRLVQGPHFAMALGAHNGAGRWFPRGPERWQRLGLRLQPWRRRGRHVLVCSSRGMGAPGLREPAGWGEDVCRRLRPMTRRPVRLRRHPGKDYAARPLERDLDDAWAMVVWGSNAATQALVEGVPVFFEGPALATAGAAERGIAGIEMPARPDRRAVFERLAWAQWSLAEIAAGDPFRHLLCREGGT